MDRLNPIVNSTDASHGSNKNLNVPSVPAPIPASSMLVGLFGIRDASAVFTPPDGMTARQQFTNPLGVRIHALDEVYVGPGATGARSGSIATGASWVGQLVVLRMDPMPAGAFEVGPYCEADGDFTHVLRFTPGNEAETRPIPADHLSYDFGPGTDTVKIEVEIPAPGYTLQINQGENGEPGDALRLFLHGDPVTYTAGEACVPDTPTCGEGEEWDGEACVPVTPTCDAGQLLVNGVCVTPVVNTDPPPPITPPAEEPIDPPLPPAQVDGLDPIRIGGDDRIETAVLVSESLFDDGAAAAVVLARADIPADAIAATPFSVAIDAPVLLTGPQELDPRTRAEILRVLAPGGVVYIAGGDQAIFPAAETELQSLGIQTDRISGSNRFSTATEIADRLFGLTSFTAAYSQVAGTMVFLADGSGFRDATVAGPAAANVASAVLLTDGERMPAETAAWLASNPVMSAIAVGQLAGSANPTVEQVGNADYFVTATAVADRFFSLPTVVGIATHVAFADPLVGGVDIARRGGALLLTQPDVLPTSVATWVSGHRTTLAEIRIYGGVLAVDDDVADALSAVTLP